MASGVPLGKGAPSWGLQQDCRWARGTPKGRKEVQQGFLLLVGGNFPLGSLLEPFFHYKLFPGFICVFLMRQCSEWQSGGSCLTPEVRSNGLPGASPVSFSSPPPCHGDPGGASDPGGWMALRVLALSMSNLSRNHHHHCGDLLSEPWVGKGACGGLGGSPDIKALNACPQIQVLEKRECLSCKFPLLCFLLLFCLLSAKKKLHSRNICAP